MNGGFYARLHPPAGRPIRMFVALGAALAASGCVSFSQDGGMSTVVAATSTEIGRDTVKLTTDAEAKAARGRVGGLLARPLTADSAVQIALLNNRGLQAAYNALGISEAAYVQASLPPNPTFSLERVAAPGELEIERRLAGNVLALLTLPARREIAERQFRQAQYRAIEATFRLAANTRRAYYRAVAARQTASFLEQARLSADAAADLTRKLGETGAMAKLDQARAGVFYAEVSNELAQARLRARTEREALTRQLGLWGRDIDYKLPGALPGLPRLRKAPDVEADAIRRRVDLIAARIELEATAKSLGLTEATRFVSVLELAGLFNEQRVREERKVEETHPKGFELEIQIPIFDGGQVALRRGQETYMQAVNRLVERAVNIRSEARSAYQTYRATYDITRQYQNNIIPLRKIISDEILLQYNGMLVDVFELLTNSREQIESNVRAIEAKRDFFIADVNFQAALIGGGEASGESGEAGGETAAAAPATDED